MNAKKAKALRKLMRNVASSQAEGEKTPERAYLELTKRRKYVEVALSPTKIAELEKEAATITTADGSVLEAVPTTEKVQVASGQVINDPKSQRAMYRQLKQRMGYLEAAQLIS